MCGAVKRDVGGDRGALGLQPDDPPSSESVALNRSDEPVERDVLGAQDRNHPVQIRDQGRRPGRGGRRNRAHLAQGGGTDRVGPGKVIVMGDRGRTATGDSEQGRCHDGDRDAREPHALPRYASARLIGSVPMHRLYIEGMNLTSSRSGQGDRRRLKLRAVAASLALVASLVVAPTALADTQTTLTVVGTSDASDSGLVPNVLQPAFNRAYPQFTFKYIGTATGTAISDAESGSVGASALIVHAASLENQFVQGGYSYEHYGRAIFTNDFVLAGAKADPAGVAVNGTHNIAQSFADIATAGAAGKATFVSRGGTPGTTVEEHKLWALVLSSNLAPSSLLLCAVNATSGGGDTPIAPGKGVTNSGAPCPNGGALPTASELPTWYVATGLTQGPNVIAANACNFPNGNSSCYVLTDRGTYDYLASGTDPAGAIPGLTIVSRDNAAATPGGANALINYFHSYVINPSKPGETVNLTAAQDWANFLTAPATQERIAAYLNKTSDPGGAPFRPDASPLLTVKGLPRTYHAGKPVTLTGTLTNAEPGYPALNGIRVTVSQIAGPVPVPVASATTNRTGSYRISFTPPVSGSYEVDTPAIAKVEDATLNPVFGDLLSPSATAPQKLTVHAAVTSLQVSAAAGRAIVFGSVAPGFGHVHGTVTVDARRAGHGAYRRVTSIRLAAADGNFAVAVARAAGRWQFRVTYADSHQVTGTTSRPVTATIGPPPARVVSWRFFRLFGGHLTVLGRVSGLTPARVELLALRTAGTGPRLTTVGQATARNGKFSIRATLRLGYRYTLFVRSGASVAPVHTVAVR